MAQKSTLPFQTIYVNDQSTDRTGALVDAYKEEHQLTDNQLLVIHNEQRLGSGVGNIYNVVHKYIEDYNVVVCVDGDDFLAYSGVLKRLEKEYQDPAVWMTFGSFVAIPEGIRFSNCTGYPEQVIKTRSFRYDYTVPSHVKTFRAKLFKQIKREDLINPETGNFYTKAWDSAMLLPMFEMCAHYDGTNHSRFISDILYIYNNNNPLSDHRGDSRDEQLRLDRLIRKKPPYEPLRSLFGENDL
jgi:glycosyltransferase involved in cell wall biosynthesis